MKNVVHSTDALCHSLCRHAKELRPVHLPRRSCAARWCVTMSSIGSVAPSTDFHYASCRTDGVEIFTSSNNVVLTAGQDGAIVPKYFAKVERKLSSGEVEVLTV